jgi:cytochrome P450
MNTIPNEGIIRYLGPFNQERLLITTPKGLSEVLTTKSYDFIKPQMLRYSLGRILGIGLLLAEGDEHKLQRKNLMPAFSFRHIKDLYSVFWSKGREGVQAIMEEIKDKAAQSDGKATAVIEASSWASRITLDIIGVAGMGRDFEAIKNPNNRLTQAYNRVFKPSVQARILQLLGLIVNPRFLSWVPLQRNKDLEDAAKIIRAECHELINEKKRKLAQSKLDDVDILSVALTSGGFSDSNLVDQLMTFLAAGHETTASALTWAIYLLAKNPEMQSRLRAEVRAHLPPLGNPGDDDQNSTVTSVDIDRLPYLNAVCNEVLRYFPPAPLTLRRAARDTTICGVHIPKNTQVMVVPWAINRSRALWGDDAEVFNPDRWMPASEGDSKRPAGGGAVSNYAFLTFLHGPRSCIGQAFAKSEFACLLATWVGRLSWELENKEEMDESKLQIRGGVTARPANGMWIRATVVEGW